MKKITAVLISVFIFLTSFTVTTFANYQEKTDTPTTKAASGTTGTMSSSTVGAILRGLLGDAADNLSNDELGQIIQKLFGDVNISSLLGPGSNSFISEILEYLASLETTVDYEAATKPHVTTTEATTEEPTTEEPTTAEPTTAQKVPSTTAAPVVQYYYYYIEQTTAQTGAIEGILPENTTSVQYDYIPPETFYTDLLTPSGVDYTGEEDDSDGFGIKTVIGVIVMLGSGTAVIILCLRKRNSYI